MQPIEAFPEGEWDFSRIFSMEEPDFTPELLAQCSLPFEHDEEQNLTWPNLQGNANGSMVGFNESLFFSWNTLNPNLNFVSEYISNSDNHSSDVALPVSSNHETCGDFNYILATNDNTMSMDICSMIEKNASSNFPVFPDEFVMVENGNVVIGSKQMLESDANELHLKRKFDVPEPTTPLRNLKKKSRVTKDAAKTKKNVQSKKNQKVTNPSGNDEEPSNGGPVDGQTTSSYCSEEDDNASLDSNGGASSDSKVSQTLNSSGKTRAGRGSATDPQSLYARRRRERINERLRILQNLVPNGTKVDISTMLEEAVHYVKFLQLQIKLLSSDELWMYAPLAYNGIDIGLNQKISMLL